ncbi:putative hmg box transcriptional protein [Venturia nashicola]|uniref:Putative hmg box transcriptional protein n=1 Tax=Venturia nashicola TaxID=86259 RepID=A0A4Z1P5T8_9PEZI|nr:putative hmg box transcriptional protein [Venturia nashicola]TLD36842.1 putative hmg box transcriptional protein [Venturia nashicola]
MWQPVSLLRLEFSDAAPLWSFWLVYIPRLSWANANKGKRATLLLFTKPYLFHAFREAKTLLHIPIHPTIRLSKRNQPELSTASIAPLDINNEKLYSLANISETLQSIPARMTRNRTADIAYVVEEEEQSHIPEVASRPEDNPQPSIETIEKICLCQPDPKIPRPRNAFILYRQRHQQSIVAQHPRLHNPEISKIAGELWRAEPDHVKSEWKSLADEEKSRHAQQYPDYRFQPRHKSKSVTASTSGDHLRCSKCGGRSIIATGPPFPSSGTALQASAGALKIDNPSTRSVASQSSGNMSTFPQHPRGLTIDPNRTDPRFHHPGPSPTMRRFAEDSIEHIQESKRARYEGWNPNRSESTRTSNTGHHQPLPQRRTPPSSNSQLYQTQETENQKRSSSPPRVPNLHDIDRRRNSLQLPRPQPQSQVNGLPYFGHQLHSPGRHPLSPATSSSSTLMRPPPPRGFPPPNTNANGYPVTPTTARLMHDPTDPGNGRRMSEMMHIPSLLTTGAPDESRSVEAMVMSIPFFNKLKVIRQVARRIDESYLSTPGHHIRGTILAIEGDDPQAVDGVITSLSDILQRSGEFDVRCMSGPAAPSPSQGECDFKDYMSEILQWHEKSKHIIDFITGVEHARNETPTQAPAGGTIPIVKQEYTTLDDQEMDTSTYSSPSDTETPSASRTDSQDTFRERVRAASVASLGRVAASVGQPRECTPNTSSSSSSHNLTTPVSENSSIPHGIPLLLINNHILHATNVWASSIPITDSYSPVDQWRWFASLWRGIIGADVTVYIKALGTGNANNGGSVNSGGGGNTDIEAKKTTCKAPAVEIKEEFGMIVVRQDGERVDDSAVRRVGFEVGEWARRIALGAGERW